ncbi:hypothetical protein OZX73_04425 [Bifidobacterium sp. ESL0775]|uniref:hypothetical protein n=1 Tax=Bifidobacterium sp. ESL0775 TaxID=2983230 RepID=UPI0023F8F0E2|nr:hypothetical protein [Bifidobacterium sp. ESL0775]WEV68553.1 hypothetical protein OZX73_04425 [Bifidobacterium sp. ESL0775]
MGAKDSRHGRSLGDRSPDKDFLYRDELQGWKIDGNLTRLDVIWSRYGEKRHI